MSSPSKEIRSLLSTANCLFSLEEVDQALIRLAHTMDAELCNSNPVLLPIMNGGLSFAASLIRQFHFPLQLDYMHLTRYRDQTSGGEVEWIYQPRIDLAGRTVVIIDDLLDLGVTLREAVDYCIERGAAVKTAVLIVKELANRPGLQTVDYFALRAPDKYLFGYGMDYKSYWRNAPGIFAI